MSSIIATLQQKQKQPENDKKEEEILVFSTTGPLGAEVLTDSQRKFIRPKEQKANFKNDKIRTEASTSRMRGRKTMGVSQFRETLAEKTKSEVTDFSHEIPGDFEARLKKHKIGKSRLGTHNHSLVERNFSELMKLKVQSGTGGSTTSQLFDKKTSLPNSELTAKVKEKLTNFLNKKTSLVTITTDHKLKEIKKVHKAGTASLKILTPTRNFAQTKDS